MDDGVLAFMRAMNEGFPAVETMTAPEARAVIVNRHYRFETEVVGARFDAGEWVVETSTGESFVGRFLLCAQLRRPIRATCWCSQRVSTL